MLVRRLSILALLTGSPFLLANCSSDGSPGPTAGAPSSSAGSSAAGSAAAGQPSAGAPAGGSAAAMAGGGSTSVAGGGAGGSIAVAGSATGGTGTGGTGTGGAAVAGGSNTGAGAAGKAGGGSGGSAGGGTTGGFTLTSTEIVGGMTIPEAHTCDGKGGQMNWGVAPSFKWTNPPAGTMSYAFFMIDWTLTMMASPDVNGYHSAAWNIPTTITEFPKGWGATNVGTGKVINGGYLGPCPPNGPDTYHMIIMALPMASYTITGTGTADVKKAYDMLKGVALATAELTGTYKKKAP